MLAKQTPKVIDRKSRHLDICCTPVGTNRPLDKKDACICEWILKPVTLHVATPDPPEGLSMDCKLEVPCAQLRQFDIQQFCSELNVLINACALYAYALNKLHCRIHVYYVHVTGLLATQHRMSGRRACESQSDNLCLAPANIHQHA